MTLEAVTQSSAVRALLRLLAFKIRTRACNATYNTCRRTHDSAARAPGLGRRVQRLLGTPPKSHGSGLGDCGCLKLDHEPGLEETGHAEQGADGLAAVAREDGNELTGSSHERIDIGCIHI